MNTENCTWINTEYDSRIEAYHPHLLDSLKTFATKREAIAFCKKHRFPQTCIDRVGSRFWKAWGIREDPQKRMHTFLAADFIYEE